MARHKVRLGVVGGASPPDSSREMARRLRRLVIVCATAVDGLADIAYHTGGGLQLIAILSEAS